MKKIDICPVCDENHMLYEELTERTLAKAYCPYSNFHVGAIAFFTQGGFMHPCFGVNVENASYGLTMCAERNAIFNGISKGFKHLAKVVVSCVDAKEDDPPRLKTPCGACRQVIQEFAVDDQIPIIIEGVGKFTLEELLPMGFKLNENS